MLRVDQWDNGTAFRITYMSWDQFRDVVLNPGQFASDWNDILKKDCIIGGLDYSIDHR